ncbi:hypothetical protein ACIQUQ_28780 [Streptomyces sp. NPDC101118]|uniref:hypothetical protein n=1 Tax=Streptomyces sp. NPDC101118 TaxID=3366109 RepID=UPI003812A7B4
MRAVDSRTEGVRTAEPQADRAAPAHAGTRVLLVAPHVRAAAVLLGEERGPGAVTALCPEAGGAEDRSAYARAAAEATRRGCPADAAPRPLRPEGLADTLLRELYAVRPDRVVTGDPHAVRDGGAAGAWESELALAVLDAVEEYQRATGTPVFTDCRVVDHDAWPAVASRPRYPAPLRWAVRGTDGRVTAYLPVPGAVVRWTEGADGRWGGPELLPVPGLLPGLTVVQGPDGYARLLGLRRTAAGADWSTEVVGALQYQTGRPLGPWHVKNNPHRSEPERGKFIGMPAAVCDGAGTLHLFLRNDLHTLNHCYERENGAWSGWTLLRGTRASEDLAALRVPDGGVELYARLRDHAGTVRWHRGGPDGAWAEDRRVPVHPVPGSLAAAPDAGALRYRYAETGEPCEWRWGAQGPAGLNAPGVTGRIAGVQGVPVGGWSCTVLAAEDERGTCAIGTYVDGAPESGVWWSPTGRRTLVPPAVVRDRTGRVMIATLSPSGRLEVTRQIPGQALDFAAWETIG